MNAAEFVEARKRLDISGPVLAVELNLTPDIVRRFEDGSLPVPKDVEGELRWRLAAHEREDALAAKPMTRQPERLDVIRRPCRLVGSTRDRRVRRAHSVALAAAQHGRNAMHRIAGTLCLLLTSACGPLTHSSAATTTTTYPIGVRYPALLAFVNIEGEAHLRVAIDSTGRPIRAMVTVPRSTHELFTIALRNEVLRWRFVNMPSSNPSVIDVVATFRLLTDSACKAPATRSKASIDLRPSTVHLGTTRGPVFLVRVDACREPMRREVVGSVSDR